MKIRVPDYYENFKCIAGACTDTCCAGWQVDVDDASYEYYKTIKGEFGERLHSVMVDGKKGAEGQFRIRPDGRCPFLNDNNLCDLYAALGEAGLCVTCDRYPRYTTEYGNLRETGIALSCKTAAELILKDNCRPNFKVWEDPDEFPSLNNIDGEFFYALMEARKKAFDIVSNRKYNIWDRISILVYYATDLQKKIKKPSLIKDVINMYDEAYIDKALSSVKKERYPEFDIYDLYKGYFYNYLKQVIIKREWLELVYSVYDNVLKEGYCKLLHEFGQYYQEREYEYENLITYFIFRYFMKAVFDRDVLTKVKMGVVSLLIIYQCDIAHWVTHNHKLEYVDQIEITHLYSREVEHSEENFETLCKLFSKKKMYAPKKLVMLLQKNAERE